MQDGVEPFPRDFHNLFVIVVFTLVLAWMAKVLYQLFRAADLNARLSRSQSLQLEGMSFYASDFQMLIRQHFNQILRIRRTVPPKPVARHALSIHLHPDTIGVLSGSGPPGDRASGAFGVQFACDALVPCCVKLFWGVSVPACNQFVHRLQHGSQASDEALGWWGAGRDGGAGSVREALVRAGAEGGGRARRWPRPGSSAQDTTRSLLEMEDISGRDSAPGASSGQDSQQVFQAGQYWAQSRDFYMPAGNSQRYVTPAGDLIDPAQLTFDVSAPWLRDGQAVDDSAVMPLVIVIIAQRRPYHELGTVQGRPVVEAHGQVSFVKFRRGEDGRAPASPEIVRQLCFGERSPAYEIHGIYGFEDEGEGECMICYDRPKNVLLLPCHHCTVCHQCLRSLRDEKCPLCRSAFSSYVTLQFSRAAPPEVEDAPAAESVPAEPAAAAAEPAADAERDGTQDGVEGKGEGKNAYSSPTPEMERLLFAGAAPAWAEPPAPEPAARQAREALPTRPRGVAPAARTTTAQALRLSGRARFSDRAGDADTPLLQEGGPPLVPTAVQAARGAHEADGEAEAPAECRAAPAPAAEAPVEETGLMQAAEAD
ncbi:unnamed protein product [Prorocentrum cordatum]|uniref:RING-type domain-containing protein n=1 Tax=Prorocentrum cordatum TaxID=2364126 RepID=A0ABN9Y8A8_9DINO|nr:unnamed protein product [Polarella glacialis]